MQFLFFYSFYKGLGSSVFEGAVSVFGPPFSLVALDLSGLLDRGLTFWSAFLFTGFASSLP